MRTINKNTKLNRYSDDNSMIMEAIECGVNDNLAKTLAKKKKTKDKIQKSQNTREYGSRKPKKKNHKKDTIRQMSTYLVELEDEEDDIAESEYITSLLEKPEKKISLNDLKNMKI